MRKKQAYSNIVPTDPMTIPRGVVVIVYPQVSGQSGVIQVNFRNGSTPALMYVGYGQPFVHFPVDGNIVGSIFLVSGTLNYFTTSAQLASSFASATSTRAVVIPTVDIDGTPLWGLIPWSSGGGSLSLYYVVPPGFIATLNYLIVSPAGGPGTYSVELYLYNRAGGGSGGPSSGPTWNIGPISDQYWTGPFLAAGATNNLDTGLEDATFLPAELNMLPGSEIGVVITQTGSPGEGTGVLYDLGVTLTSL